MAASSIHAFITAPLPDVGAWCAALRNRTIPVLEATAAALAELREIEDSVDARMLSEAIAGDALMTLKVLRHVAEIRRDRSGSSIETVTAATVLLGVPPFFRAFASLQTLEDRLGQFPEALAGAGAVMQRAHRAAQFALGFAVHRMDHDAEVIHEAALLHDFTELLLWANAPSLALEIQRSKHRVPGMRSTEAQRHALNIELHDLQQALMHEWNLPDLLVRISDDHETNDPQVRNVQLAIRIAKHSANGWDHPALQEDLAASSTLLNLSESHTLQLLLELDS